MLIAFSLDFILHIIFAANDWDLAFQIVAFEIAIIVHFFGPLALLCGGPIGIDTQKQVMKYGFIIGSVLTMGYWWAVNGMVFDWWIIATPTLCWLAHFSLKSRYDWICRLLYTGEVQNVEASGGV